MRKERLWDLLYICVTAHGSSVFCVSQEQPGGMNGRETHLPPLHSVRIDDTAHGPVAAGSKDKSLGTRGKEYEM